MAGAHESQICQTNTREWECQQYPPWEIWNVDRDTICALCQCVDSQCYLLTKQGVQWSQGEPGTAGEQTQPCERAEEDEKGHGRGRGRGDKSCLCFLSHSSPLRGIHLHTWREKALPFALLSVLLKHKQVPLSGPDNSPACLLSVFAQDCGLALSVSRAQEAQGTKSNATIWDWCQCDSSSPQQHHIYYPAIRPKWFSPRCRKNKQAGSLILKLYSSCYLVFSEVCC